MDKIRYGIEFTTEKGEMQRAILILNKEIELIPKSELYGLLKSPNAQITHYRKLEKAEVIFTGF